MTYNQCVFNATYRMKQTKTTYFSKFLLLHDKELCSKSEGNTNALER